MGPGVKFLPVLAAGAALSGCASLGLGEAPAPQAGPSLGRAHVRAAPPSGLVRFCASQIDLCGLQPPRGDLAKSSEGARGRTQDAPLVLTPALWRTLTIVNADINWMITPARDEDLYGVREMWAMPISQAGRGGRRRGDCEDYVLEKRARLIAAGFDPAALQIAVAFAPQLGRHTVLIVRTDRGDLVLDNRYDDVVGVDEAPYQWLARQDGPDLLNWVALEGVGYERAPLQSAQAPAASTSRLLAELRPTQGFGLSD